MTVDNVREDVLVSSLFLLGKTINRNKRYWENYEKNNLIVLFFVILVE